MKVEKPLNQFCRDDGFNPGVDFSSSIQEEWIHKQYVKKLGESEDDFIIEEKPVLVKSYDLHKQIQEEAKTTDLKYLLEQFLRSGDESVFDVRRGFGGDITQIQNALENHGSLISPEQIRSKLGDEFGSLTAAQIASMSDADIVRYVNKVRSDIKASEEASKSEQINDKKEG